MAKEKTPDFKSARLVITLVPHGYEVDVTIDGKSAGGQCRDYGGRIYNINKAILKLIKATARLEQK